MAIISLRSFAGPVLDQGNLNMCAPYADIASFNLLMNMARKPLEPLSAMQLYADIRTAMGTFSYDSGTADGVDLLVAQTKGVASESVWSNDPSNLYNSPTQAVYEDASTKKVLSYTQLNTATQFTEMARQVKEFVDQGKGVLISFNVRDWFMAQTGPTSSQVSKYVPGTNSDYLHGGHRALIVGHDDRGTVDTADDIAIIKNSWGEDWGDNGYGTISYSAFGNGTGHISDMLGMYVVNGFAGVDIQWTAARENAAELYTCALNRSGDKGGIANMGNLLSGGTSMSQIADWMIDSAEGQIQFPPSWSNAQIADQMYLNVLGRHADNQNLAGLLDTGWTKGQAIVLLMDSIDEYTGADAATKLEAQRYDNRAHISQYYGITLQGEGIYSSESLAEITADRMTVEAAKERIFDAFSTT